MKYIKSYLFLVLTAALALTGCKQDDLQDDVDALANRVAILEEQVKLLNENLETISFVLNSENKTIQSVTQSGNAYTLTLSNGETLTLNIGVQGSAEVPEITIGSDGCWVVRGESTGVPAIGNAGADGQGYPEFRVNEGSWEVRYVTGDGEVSAWEKVGGDANSDMGVVGDQLIASAEVMGNEFVITYYTDYATGETATASVAIVPGLVCAIDDSGLTLSDPDGYLEVAEDSRTEIPVQISGGTPSVTYPAGWRATIEQADSSEGENNYVLAIYSPASGEATGASSRVTADNTSEVTVRVNSGMYWAVDKIKVRIEGGGTEEPTYTSVYDKYEKGGDITVGNYTFNNQSGLTVTHVTSTDDITIENNVDGVYIIDTDATLNFPNALLSGVSNLILLSNDLEGNKKAKVNISLTNAVSLRVAGSGTTSNIVAQNIEFTSGCLVIDMADDATSTIDNLIFDGCKFTLPNNRHLFNGDKGQDNSIKNIQLLNNDICISENSGGVSTSRLLNFAVTGKCIDVNASIDVENNVIYTRSTNNRNNGAILSVAVSNDLYGDFQGSITIKDNTFINMSSSGQGGLLRAHFNNAQVTISNCLFWDNVENTTQNACRLLNTVNKVNPTTTIENIKAYSKMNGSEHYVTYQYYYQSNKPDEAVNLTISQEEEDPLQTADFENGIFIVKAGVNCGATR